MATVKAGRNKTIDTPLSEGQIYLDRCIAVTQRQVDLGGVLDKTVIGDMLDVCSLLPPKSIDLIIADPPYNLTKSFVPTELQVECIRESVDRAISFLNSAEYGVLNDDLNDRVRAVESEIAIAAFIDNVNLRGRIIEYLITAEDDLKATLMNCLHTRQPLPEIFTADELGDYEREFEHYLTETDIKTKVLFLSSNPKGYNIDKLLSFLSEEKSVYLVFVVAIDEDRTIQTRLCSMFNRQLLSGTRIIKHWAGRNSRGVTQYEGRVLEAIVEDFDSGIDYDASQDMITDFLRG